MSKGSRRPRRSLLIRTTAIALVLTLTLATAARSESPTRILDGKFTRSSSAKAGAGDAGNRRESSGGWWLGTAGIALALAVCGWGAVASRRLAPRVSGAPAGLKVVGRTNLSPKHSVYLLDVGGRVLLVGTGPQGPPSLLGELDDPPAPVSLTPPPLVRFDRRVGDES